MMGKKRKRSASPGEMAYINDADRAVPAGPRFTNLQLVEVVDSWPYLTKDPAAYKKHMESYYYFLVKGYDKPFGYIHNHFIAQMPYFSWGAEVDHSKRQFTLLPSHDSHFEGRTELMNYILRMWDESGTAPGFSYWGNETKRFPLMSSTGEHVLDIDGSGVDVFGIIKYSVHLVGWVKTPEGIKICVPRRALTKATFPGLLDSTVAGNLATREKPIDGIIRKCQEEMQFSPDYTRANIKACGTNSFQMTVSDKMELACQYQVQYLYEMEFGIDIIPKISGGAVGEIHFLSVKELQKVMANGEVKLTSNMAYLDFLIRHGYVNSENEQNFVEICSRLHRRHDLFFA